VRKRLSLWVLPRGEALERLQGLVSRLSEKYETPAFKPHVTALGGLDGTEDETRLLASNLASLLGPYRVRLGEAGYSEDYYRCLYLRVKETREVMGACALAREIFGRAGERPYLPHLSIIYGYLPEAEKRRIIKETHAFRGMDFEVGSIHLFSTSNEPRQWREVAEFPLGA
jgi:2'-5' RNA ligase